MTGKAPETPVSILTWLDQVDEDPSIPSEYKHGAQDQLKLSSTSLSSGSSLGSTGSLHLKTVWHPYPHIDSLGKLMTDDPISGYNGYVSSENNDKAGHIFGSKRARFQPYLGEMKLLAAEEAKAKITKESQSSGLAVPRQPLRPSRDCENFRSASYWQSQITATANGTSTSDGPQISYSITKSGGESVGPYAPLSVNQPPVPVTPKSQSSQQDTPKRTAHSTPEVTSYRLAKRGKSNRPAADESYVNTALLLLLQAIILEIEDEFSTLDWLATRLPLKIMDRITTANTNTEEDYTEVIQLMEARVDGYLCRRSHPLEKKLNSEPLAICEVKPFTRGSALTAIRRQEGAEMACWISQAGESNAGLLETSTSGRKRRLMINQDRHEITIVVGEYGAGFENHIRPSRSATQRTAKSGAGGDKLGGSVITTPAQANPFPVLPSTQAEKRDPGLLAGSPAYLNRVERKLIAVRGPDEMPQKIRPAPSTKRSRHPKKKGKWDAGDFLIMHEFGPFLVQNAGHMEVLIKRLIAFMLQLRGPQERFVPMPPSPRFLLQPSLLGTYTPDETLPRRITRLKKSRSWPARTERSEEDWESLSVKPTWE
ncbi:hypothetical protein N8I77_007109 [Diaporthe amygdali]|uniref:Uncharacterized protein n=1 Tax=Phomopsis amygdali TaxID=1214568 RepID=A0AAD9SC75_PHOAM|nr:hypothetical protein N8I77_007109 [Diaporthe amygdali]